MGCHRTRGFAYSREADAGWLLKLLCSWSELGSDSLEGENDFASCHLSHESCALPASFLGLRLHPWVFSLREKLFFLLLQDTDLFKGERLKANEVSPLRIMHCNW